MQDIKDEVLYKRIEKIKSRKKNSVWVLGTIAGINNKAKGQQYVIKAMSQLGQKYNIRYELVGTGSREYLQSIAQKYHIEDKVVFKGEMTHKEVLEWLDTIDTYIQPSMQEGLPRALIEAMSRGCPAIGSTTAGIPELLEEGCIFARGKVDKLIEVMRNCYDIDWSGQAIRNHSKAKEYQIDILNARREKLYVQYKEFVLKRES